MLNRYQANHIHILEYSTEWKHTSVSNSLLAHLTINLNRQWIMYDCSFYMFWLSNECFRNFLREIHNKRWTFSLIVQRELCYLWGLFTSLCHSLCASAKSQWGTPCIHVVKYGPTCGGRGGDGESVGRRSRIFLPRNYRRCHQRRHSKQHRQKLVSGWVVE